MALTIYAIRNIANGKLYIGSTIQVPDERFLKHRSDLRHRRHSNEYLQRAWDKYGADSFQLEVVAEGLSIKDRDAIEASYIEQFQSYADESGYNLMRPIGSHLGHSPETRAKMSASKKGRKVPGKRFSPEGRAALSAARLGRPGPNMGRKFSAEVRAKMAEGQRRRAPDGPETRRKKSLAKTGVVASAETRAKISASKRGIPATEESKAAQRQRFIDNPELRIKAAEWAKLTPSRRGFKHTPEARAKMSETQKARLAAKRAAALQSQLALAA